MECLKLTIPGERVALDLDRLGQTCTGLPPHRIEECISIVLERIAVELSMAERAWWDGDSARLLASLAAVSAAADELGMVKLAGVASSVRDSAEAGDGVAVAATLARLLRVGEGSLLAVWDRQMPGA